MTTIHPAASGQTGLSARGGAAAQSRSVREGSAAGLLVGVGALVTVLGIVVHVWWGDLGHTIAVMGVLVLLPAALLQSVIGIIDGLRDHDPAGESRSAAFGLLGGVAVVACLLVALALGA